MGGKTSKATGREGSHPPESSGSSRHQKEAQSPAEDTLSSSQVHAPAVHIAYGDRADVLLKDAVRFVETECQIRLIESPDLHRSSPLLVFCKNDTKLQEDIRHAIENTRDGADVMLLIITDKKGQVLRDTEATQHLGAKGCLLYNQIRQKFSFTENKQNLKWIRKFLEKFQIDVILKLNRTDSFRQTWTKLRKSEEMGSYLVLGDLSEEQLKNIVLFFDDRNVGLTETDHEHTVSPLVVLCAANQQPEQRLHTFGKARQDLRDVFLVIIHRNCEEVPVYRSFTDVSQGKLATSDMSASVLDSAQNKRLVEGIRKFLRKHTAPSQRRQIPPVDTLFSKRDPPEGGDHRALCVSSDSGCWDPEGLAYEDDTIVMYSSAAGISEDEYGPVQRVALMAQSFQNHSQELNPQQRHEHPPDTVTPSTAEQDYPPVILTAQDSCFTPHALTGERNASGRQILQARYPSERQASQVLSTKPPQHPLQPSTYSPTFSQVPESPGEGWVQPVPCHMSLEHPEDQYLSLRILDEDSVSVPFPDFGPDSSHRYAKQESWRWRQQSPALSQVRQGDSRSPLAAGTNGSEFGTYIY